ncbi:Protein THYLAKOID FORMATION 1, chloroplastic [Asimina triloba]
MAVISSLSFAALGLANERKLSASSVRSPTPGFEAFRIRIASVSDAISVRSSNASARLVVRCMTAASDVPTVSETKLNFLKSYKRPIPSIYNTVLQELIVQQHLMRYKKTYKYDAVFALGFVTVYDQLMEGYPSNEDRHEIFRAYIRALKENPEQYSISPPAAAIPLPPRPPKKKKLRAQSLTLFAFQRKSNMFGIFYRADTQKLEEWARSQNAVSLVEFPSREGDVESILKDISERARGKGSFSYSRFFAIGLFRLLELANATEPTILEKKGGLGNVIELSVDRDLDVYRNLLSKLVQAKELLKEYVDREKKKQEERVESQKANEAIKKCTGDYRYAGL